MRWGHENISFMHWAEELKQQLMDFQEEEIVSSFFLPISQKLSEKGQDPDTS